MEKYLGIILIITLTFFAKTFWQAPVVLGESTPSPTETLPAGRQVLPVNQPVTTESSFTEKLQEETESLPKKVIYQDDPETEAGEEKVLEEGSDGKKIKIFKITYYKPTNTSGGPARSADGSLNDSQEGLDSPEVNRDEEYSRELISVETTPAKDKKILRGTKIVWRTLDTADGSIQYWKKLRVWATHYDGGAGCMGCSGRGITATGLKVGKGVVAVDPTVIKLGTQMYVPGYGKAVAGDTGGNIIGSIIDLGFDDARTAGWYAHFVDIYLLDRAPN